MDSKNIVLNVNGIEVIYNHVILVLKGVSLSVPEGSIVAILGGNGAGKTTTLRAISNLLKAERGEVTKGSIELRGERIENLSPRSKLQSNTISGWPLCIRLCSWGAEIRVVKGMVELVRGNGQARIVALLPALAQRRRSA